MAKELAFKMPAREVEEIFRNQKLSYFLAGPMQGDEAEVASIVDFVSHVYWMLTGYMSSLVQVNNERMCT